MVTRRRSGFQVNTPGHRSCFVWGDGGLEVKPAGLSLFHFPKGESEPIRVMGNLIRFGVPCLEVEE
jgi:hypothetical protein